jgi:hypothetical protein
MKPRLIVKGTSPETCALGHVWQPEAEPGQRAQASIASVEERLRLASHAVCFAPLRRTDVLPDPKRLQRNGGPRRDIWWPAGSCTTRAFHASWCDADTWGTHCEDSGPSRRLRRRGPLPSRRRALAASGRTPGLSRQRAMRGGRASFLLERSCDGARSLGRRLPRTAAALLVVASCAFPGPLRGLPFSRRRQVHTSLPRLRQANGDRLLRRTRAVLAFTDVMDLLPHELSRLGRRALAGTLRGPCPFDRGFRRHETPPEFLAPRGGECKAGSSRA